jgi:deoxyadenosine/deoxycytidine kinase
MMSVINNYNASDVLIVDMDHTDVVKRPEDALRVCREVDERLKEILNMTKAHIG